MIQGFHAHCGGVEIYKTEWGVNLWTSHSMVMCSLFQDSNLIIVIGS
jgi:hypothetical protein